MNRVRMLVVAATAAAAGVLSAGGVVAGAAAAPPRLALMPLPKQVLGGQVAGLPLAPESGVVTNAQAASDANAPTTAAKMKALGRLTGYQLVFGSSAPSQQRIFDVQTEVELYASAAAARGGLAFWEKDGTDVHVIRAIGAKVSISTFRVSGLGAGSFADDGTLAVPGARVLYGAEVGFRLGSLVGMVNVSGSDVGRARALAVADAHLLRARMLGVLSGRLHPAATALPAAGPPHGGPDLARLALAPSDFVAAKLEKQGYVLDTDLNPLAEYKRSLSPAGSIASFQESVALFSDPVQASSELALFRALLSHASGVKALLGNLGAYDPHPVAFTAGDESFAVRGTATTHGVRIYLTFSLIRVGRTLETIVAAGPVTVPLSDANLNLLGRAAATRVASGLGKRGVA